MGFITSLTNLKILTLAKFPLIEANILTGLQKLENLRLSENSVVEISGLNDFASLKDVYLWQNNIPDLNGFNNCPQLANLNASENQIGSVAGLTECPMLKNINLGFNCIDDLSWIDRLPALELVSFCDNKVTELGDLTALPSLSYLDLRSNSVASVDGLTSYSLRVLDLDINELENLDGIALPALEEIYAQWNPLADISGLAQCPVLIKAYLEHDRVQDISVLGALAHLVYVDIGANNMDLRSGSPNFEVVQALRSAGCGVADWGNVTDESIRSMVTATERAAFTQIFGSEAENYQYTDMTFEPGCIIDYTTLAEYSGAIVGPTSEQVLAGIVSVPVDKKNNTIEEFVGDAVSLPLVNQVFAPNTSLSYTQGFRTIGSQLVWCENGGNANNERRLYLFKYDDFFIIITYYCNPKGFQVLADDVEPVVENLINDLFPE